MAPFPRWNSLRPSLAACSLAASVIAFCAQPAAARPPGDPAAAAWDLYLHGKGLTARKDLVRLLKAPDLAAGARLAASQALLDICIHSAADGCVVAQLGPYLELAKTAPAANEIQRREQVRTTAYYLHAGQFAFGTPEVTDRILKDDIWKQENAFNGALYLRRQVLAANVALAVDDRPAATRSVDKILSLVATLENPQDQPFLVAWALAEATGVLVELGEIDRAFGVYRTTGAFVAQALPPLSIDAALYRLTQAQLLQERGDLAGAAAAVEAAITTLSAIELEPDEQGWMLANARTLQAGVCAAQGRLDCAQAALKAHPYARAYARPGRAAGSYEELVYLAVRGLVSALAQAPDPVVVDALARPLGFDGKAGVMDQARAYQAAGAALASAPGPERQAGLLDAGRRIAAAAEQQGGGGFGGWSRPGAIDRMLIGLALTEAERLDADDAFRLMQLAGRHGATGDADALSLLAQAGDTLQRREIHQALRLRARRDRFEREELQNAVQRAQAPASGKPILSHAYEPRSYFRDFADRLIAVDGRLAEHGLRASGANLASLADFQAVLGQDEAALALAEVPGGMAYVCVRRDRVMRTTIAAEPGAARIDIRLLQAALTAGHAPSETLDAQYPVAAATRLYDRFIRPFESCLKPGDHILWLPNASITPIPLAALLASAPPKLPQGGYDLAQADWLARRHALSYAGSPAAVVAARKAPAAPPDLDFLGVGDPILSGATPTGEDRAKVLLRGVRGTAGLASLAALPDTAEELRRSAGGFRTTRLLMQEAATEQGVRSQLLGAYRFLSFATHGLLRDDLQGLSEPALALTPVSAADPSNDGLLTATEIADLNLAARFVALSACNTANFDMTEMAGDLPALASAFAVAGTPTVLGTLWPVDSLTGKEVVARTFERLGSGEGPARALAAAQRAFLAAPPGRAYLHPRFWAAMAVLGDGAATPGTSGPSLAPSVQALSQSGGEVVALARAGGHVVARFGEPGGAATTALEPQAWRRETARASAANILLRQGGQVIVGAAEPGADGRYAPTLQALDARSGAAGGAWRGEAPAGRDSFPMDAALGAGGEVLALIADRSLRARAAGRPGGDSLRLIAFDAALKPRVLAEIMPRADQSIDTATVTPWGEALLVTYGERFAAPAERPLIEDDFEDPICGGVPVTVVELRDARTGALRAGRRLEGWAVVEASLLGDKVLLAGARKAACIDEQRAALARLDADLTAKIVWQDQALGMSEARAVLASPDGSLLVTANKQALVDVRPAGNRRSAGALAGESRFSTVLTPIGADGRSGPPRVLDGGGDVLTTALAPGEAGGLLLGGSLAGEAVVIGLATRPREP